MLTYDEFRAVAKDGDILFLTVDKKNPLSRLTSWFTDSPYTHVAFVFWYMGRLMVAESTTHGGSRIVSASHYSNRTFNIIPAPVDWKLVAEFAMERSGTADYGWLSAVYIGIREYFFNHFGVKLPINKNNVNKACSEYVAEVLNLDDTDITPVGLFRTLGGKT